MTPAVTTDTPSAGFYRHHAALVEAARAMPADTPFVVYDLGRVRQNVAAIRRAAEGRRFHVAVHFAVKCCYVPEVLAALGAACDALDCQSAREVALCADLGPVAFHSPLLPARVLDDASVRQISCNSLEQVRRVRAAAHRRRVGFRLVLPELVEGQFVHDGSKFGLTADDIARLLPAHDGDAEPPFVHHHTHARLADTDSAVRIARRFAEGVITIGHAAGRPVRCVDIGGGWDGGFRLADAGVSLAGLIGAQLDTIEAALPDVETVIVEPGRALVEDACLAVGTVEELLLRPGQTFVIVDLATSFLVPIPAARFVAAALNPADGAPSPYVLVDGTCSPRGQIALGVWPPLALGDRVAVANCGAYTESMVSGFHSLPPAFYLLDDGRVSPSARNSHALR